MKHIKTFENVDRFITLYRRSHVRNENYSGMISIVNFLKESNIDYEICYSLQEYIYKTTRYLVYAFINSNEFYKRILLDGEYFLLDESVTNFTRKIKDIDQVKEYAISGDGWIHMSKDEFDVIINSTKYNL